MSQINFSDERLRRAVDETKSAIGDRNQNLDRISEDIKQLERYLESCGVRERIEVHLAGGPTVLGEAWEVQETGEGAAEDVSEFTTWEKIANQDRWRIMYLKSRRKGWFCVDAGGFSFEGIPQVLDHRPLIETPAIIRLRASEVLPDLVKAIAANARGPKTLAKESAQSFEEMAEAFEALFGHRQTSQKEKKGEAAAKKPGSKVSE